MLDDIPRRTEDDSRPATRLKVSSDQTHGLVADGSKRDEKDGVNSVGMT